MIYHDIHVPIAMFLATLKYPFNAIYVPKNQNAEEMGWLMILATIFSLAVLNSSPTLMGWETMINGTISWVGLEKFKLEFCISLTMASHWQSMSLISWRLLAKAVSGRFSLLPYFGGLLIANMEVVGITSPETRYISYICSQNNSKKAYCTSEWDHSYPCRTPCPCASW